MLHCNHCGKDLSETEFYLNRSKVKCKRCTLKQNKPFVDKYKRLNKEKVLEYNRDYDQTYKDKKCERNQKYYYDHKLSCIIKTAIRFSIHGKLNKKWEEAVGYTLADLKEHLEKQFSAGMSWDNYGKFGWHIDHIRPICTFKFNSIEDKEFKECWSLENLRPLWWRDNLMRKKRG